MSNVWSVSAHCILGCSVLSVVWVVVYRLQNIWSTYPVYYFFYFCLCYEAVVINILISSMPYSVFISSILHLNSILYRNVKTQVRKKINNHTRHHFLFICHSRNRRSGHSTLLQYSDHSRGLWRCERMEWMCESDAQTGSSSPRSSRWAVSSGNAYPCKFNPN